jgi:regulatory protein
MKTVKQVVKNKQYYDIEFTDNTKLTVSEDILVRFRMLKGMEITDDKLKEIRREAKVQMAFTLALHYLDYQMRSVYEMKKYLRDNDVSSTDAEKIITRLKDMKLLDDESYAGALVRTLIRTTDKGPRLVMQDLKKRGIEDEISTRAMEEYTDEIENDKALHFIEKSQKKYERFSLREKQTKIRTRMMTRGYRSSAIQFAFDNFEFETNEEEEFEKGLALTEKLWRKYSRLDERKRITKIRQQLFTKGFDLGHADEWIDEVKLNDEE